MNRIAVTVISSLVCSCSAVPTNPVEERGSTRLPAPANFSPTRYLGTWYEVARFPSAMQPNDTLATAEYAQSADPDRLQVKNTAYSRDGRRLSTIEGQAGLAAGEPPGRLRVSFGPVLPAQPNYHVLHVDRDYRHAVVGVPDRRSLWILSRTVPVPGKTLEQLVAVAAKAGFDTSRLLVADWSQSSRARPAKKDQEPIPVSAARTRVPTGGLAGVRP